MLWTGPRSLDSLIDERRDALRDRRVARSDAFRHLYGLFDPVMEYERDLHRATNRHQASARIVERLDPLRR